MTDPLQRCADTIDLEDDPRVDTGQRHPPTLDAALSYAMRGHAAVFPCHGKYPAKSKKEGGQGCKDATTDPARIRKMWSEFPRSNIGLATGKPSGFWVLDIDGPEGEEALAALEAKHGKLPDTLIGLTGGGGRHLLFKYHGELIRNRAKDIGDGLDVRATGGYIIAPPSVHPDTRRSYQWADGQRLETAFIADAPAWLIDLACGRNRRARERQSDRRTMKDDGPHSGKPGGSWAEAALTDECRKVAGAKQGGRNDVLNTAAFNLGQLVGAEELERGRVERALFAAAVQSGLVDDDGDSAALATIASGLDKGIDQPRKRPEPEPKAFRNGKANGSRREQPAEEKPPPSPAAIEPNEDAIALEFANRHADKLRYCHDWGMWLHWDGVRWERERRRLAFHFAREVAREANWEGKATPAKASTAAGVERFAQADPRLATVSDEWDVDPWKLGTPGGTVDLKTGLLRESRQQDFMTKRTVVAPADPLHGDGCPLWLGFLHQATKGDKELIRFMQQIAGYALTGDTREHALFFIYGPGGNGKGVFLNTITKILNDYATTAAMDTFTASQSDKHSTDLAKLKGARLVTASETEEGRSWAESRIKQMTGGDRISARFMRQDNFEFWPTFKLLIVGNHKPILRNVDEAARRRFNIIPFIHKPEQRDLQLEAKLEAEWPAILRWMIDGCLDWRRNGLVQPNSVTKATEEYFKSQDLFGQWLGECCELHPGNDLRLETAADLFASWKAFAESNGEHAGSGKALGDKLTQRDVGSKLGRHPMNGKTCTMRTGISLIRPAPNWGDHD